MTEDTHLHRDLGRIEGKIDGFMQEIRGSFTDLRASRDDHEKRISALEKVETERAAVVRAGRWLWGAIMAAVGVFGGYLGSHLH